MIWGVPTISHIYAKQLNGQQVIDIVTSKNGNLSTTIENIRPDEITVHSDGKYEYQAPGWMQMVTLQRMPKMSINKLRNMGFPGQLIPVTIKGKTYFIDSSYKANTDVFKKLGVSA